MSYYIRPMQKEDVPQVSEIDQEAFPTQWSPNYYQELRNRMAHYIVACDDEKVIEPDGHINNSSRRLPWLMASLGRVFQRNTNHQTPLEVKHYIIGFAGFWVMVDEAHVTSIAAREAYRGLGVGELMLMHVIDMASELKANLVTLEVRMSNDVAHNLYLKYGFTDVGIRKGYYIDRGQDFDTREDAILMSTQSLNSPEYMERLKQLKEEYYRKHPNVVRKVPIL